MKLVYLLILVIIYQVEVIPIKELENVEFNEMNLDLTVFIEKLNSGDLNIISYLDDYERNLLFEILGSN